MAAASVVLRLGNTVVQLHRGSGGEPGVCGSELAGAIAFVGSRPIPVGRQAVVLLQILAATTFDGEPVYALVLGDEVYEWDYGYVVELRHQLSWESSATIRQINEWRACCTELDPEAPAFAWHAEVVTVPATEFIAEMRSASD